MSNFCKLDSKLIISYNGQCVECLPTEDSSIVGTILIRKGGRVFSRQVRGECFQQVNTPKVFLFHDNCTDKTYKVDICCKLITRFEPEGRILDCTDRMIYEIQHDEWVPVCDLSNKEEETILRTAVLNGSSSITIPIVGTDPFVTELSPTPASAVTFSNNTATINPITSSVLIYKSTLKCVEVTVLQLLLDGPHIVPRISTQGGTLTLLLPPLTDITGTLGTPILPNVSNVNVFVNPIVKYNRPNGAWILNTTTGGYVVPSGGDYQINFSSSYVPSGAVVEGIAPPERIVLIVNNVVQNESLLNVSLDGFPSSGNASISVGLTLGTGDIIQVAYVQTDPALPTYTFDPASTSFNATFLG